jgi:adenine-specific DNA-methyltransferase
MMSSKLELTWVGKNEKTNIEPRILVENKELSNIKNDINTENMLIHGDNLLALKALEKEFTGKIKCIYIDPPYNTGSAFEQYNDNLEHSIWLNLMKLRIEILNKLLTKDGIIWISIDDDENAYLKILCDEIFGRNNFIANLPTIMNLKGNQDEFGFAGTHEYTLVYAKNKNLCNINKFEIDEEEILKDWMQDERGLYKRGATLKATGEESRREDRPFMFYPILFKDNIITTIKKEEYLKLYNIDKKEFNDLLLNELVKKYESEGYIVILPKYNENEYGRWRWGFSEENIAKLETEVICIKSRNGYSLYKKQRPELNDIPTKKPKSLLYKPEYSSGNGTEQIKKIFGYNAFPYPKPEQLISDFIYMSTNENDYVLDSFLGSGTTCAVAQKMNRKWIGIEMGEHCYTHCKFRIDKVIEGKDYGGITKAVNWQGGGGYKFYELAPTLINIDSFGEPVINKEYNAEMLASAVALHEGFKYNPSNEKFWKQSIGNENSYLYVTTKFVNRNDLDKIKEEMDDTEYLVIACTSYDKEIDRLYKNIKIKKIPEMLLSKCEFGKDNYNLNIINPLEYEEELEEDE